MSVAAPSLMLSELQQKLHIKLASTSEFSDYPPGHEAIRDYVLTLNCH